MEGSDNMLSTCNKMRRLCCGKTKQNEKRKTCFVTRAMAGIRITSGMQSTAVKTTVSSTRPQRVFWLKNGVGPWHAKRRAKHWGHRHAHLPNNREEPMELDPP